LAAQKSAAQKGAAQNSHHGSLHLPSFYSLRLENARLVDPLFAGCIDLLHLVFHPFSPSLEVGHVQNGTDHCLQQGKFYV
jgi:hypothetical protein